MANPEDGDKKNKERKPWNFTNAILAIGALAIGFGLFHHLFPGMKKR